MRELTSKTNKLSREIKEAIAGIQIKIREIQKLPICSVSNARGIDVVLNDSDILYLEKQIQWVRECWIEMKENEKLSHL